MTVPWQGITCIVFIIVAFIGVVRR